MFLLHTPNLSIPSQLARPLRVAVCSSAAQLPPQGMDYEPCSAYLPKVVLLCCSPACLSAAWLEWKCVKSLGSVISLGCSGVSAKPWRFTKASKLEDAWVLGILKGAVAFKDQEQEHTKKPKVKTPQYSWFQALCYWELQIEQTLVGEPMIVGSGVLKSQSELLGEDPMCLVGDVPRLPGLLGCGEWLYPYPA